MVKSNVVYIIIYVIMGVHRGICGRLGGIDMSNNSNVNNGFHSSPYVYKWMELATL